jgi:CheY-like chemotaxis protein
VHLSSASLPERGLEMARADLPDLILLDIQLPGMDGYEVMRQLRSHEATRAIPVIAVTANVMPQDVERAHEAGFIEYFSKPIEIGKFMKVLDRLFASPTINS